MLDHENTGGYRPFWRATLFTLDHRFSLDFSRGAYYSAASNTHPVSTQGPKMPILKLTKSNIDAIQPGPKDEFYWDPDLKGFGLKVTPAGGKIYLIQYRLGGRSGKTERYRIGPHGQYTPEQARKLAKGLLGKVAEGISPQEGKRQAKQERVRISKNSTKALIDRYYHTCLLPNRRKSHAERVYRRLEFNVVPRFGDRDFASITRAEKYELLDELIAAGKTGSAYNVKRDLSALENWALDREIIKTTNGQRMKLRIPFPERKRVFHPDEEQPKILAELDAEREPIRTGYLVLVLTLQRIESVSAMRRSMVKDVVWKDEDGVTYQGKIWTQQPEDGIYKGKFEHELPLPPEVVELLEALPNTGDFYFPGVAGLTETGYYQLASTHRRNRIAEKTGIKDWTWHDFRRTGTTWLQDAGVAPHKIDAVLGHTAKGETSAFKHYGRARMLQIKAQTLQVWVNHVLQPERSNVVELKTG
jgi:integrase